jgi:hypothetical protein
MLRAFEADLAAHRAPTRAGCPQIAPAVRVSLTAPAPRARRHRENGDYAGFLLRVIRSYGRRVAAGGLEDLTVMLSCHKAMGSAVCDAIRTARDEQGWTWADVGRAAGVTRQSAHERWSSA